ncbi:sodium/calcium exchanger family protein [Mycobacteroides abscessus 5S-0422]|uniref:Sodium/calcium exchanger family protein n=1 Tax=Mycobacteroides abscessus subsp. bolletii 1513 TaxID=1299321 RepID=X8DHY7_9MYCO|nr:sodium/hydrogen exchanger [Mycobacteroides abscessus]EUA67999.1 sodium/calcium exchanger family protein [Mycobacteroides abscessus subsp. bolletii 1513]EIU03819.1 sodium/calcium exchanger family protein [Mycobacteroides abscessus 5S-0422]EIU08805.1 sodium/calcium exchanger family protein [Mycobacteroides abscessus 5S-0304]EIU18260.1 sodium/calcium exchanger family protein [Mycobacteroides abscessus 5S-0421]EIU19995.1 sodium/calcium exchanger family protein [Mycobacteroides abscessus 5S-0708
MPTTASTPAVVGGLRRQLLRSVCITALLMAPALITRVGGLHPSPVLALVIYGAAVVAASFVLAWAAEAAQIDVSGGLAIAVLALIAVLPEYAVDLYYAYVSGHVPEYTQYAAANMTGSNRLLMGLGWPVVVLLALAVARKTSGRPVNLLSLEPSNRIELGFLTVAGMVAFVIPASGQIHLALGIALLAWFGFYLFTISRGEAEEPDLVGTAAAIGMLPKHLRRSTVVTMFVLAASVILLCAEPFANSLVSAGTQLGIDQFLLVQWLAPLASEAPEFIIAAIFAARGKGTAAIATLISSKVNQWTLLIGSLPLAHLAGGGGFSLVLDARQVEETLLTATQTMMGVALILALRFHRATAWALLALFVVQFPITSTHGRLILCGVYGVLAIAGLIVNRHHIIATIRSPFHRSATLQLTVP